MPLPKAQVPTPISSQNDMVITPNAFATKIGQTVLKNGGNAFDAMVAVELVLAITNPTQQRLSTGGVMLYRTEDNQIGILDFRPASTQSEQAKSSMLIPGTVDGLMQVHTKYGSKPLADLMNPVIRLAQKQSQTKLIQTLERIRDKGRAGFYLGETAKQLVQSTQSQGGNLTIKALNSYRSKWIEPLKIKYKTWDIVLPDSRQGTLLAQMLKVIEQNDLRSLGGTLSEQMIQLIAEVERQVYGQKNISRVQSWASDTLLSQDYLAELMQNFTFDTAGISDMYKPKPTSITTHYTIVDKWHNVVSVSSPKLSNSVIPIPTVGISLYQNNRYSKDADISPSVLVMQGERLKATIGIHSHAKGVSSLAQLLAHALNFNMNAQQAVATQQVYLQNDTLMVEPHTVSQYLHTVLTQKGYTLHQQPREGQVHLILAQGQMLYRGRD